MARINYDIKSATAARAIYPQVRGMLPKISLTFESYDGDKIEFEMELEVAARFLDEANAAYSAAIPSPRRR